MNSRPPVVLTIAGFDPSSGAGVTADIKTIAAHGCYGVACISALTVQSTQGVKRVQALPESLVRDTLLELVRDCQVAAVRIGMLGSGEVAAGVADFLKKARLPNIVLDPVVRSSSGADLLGAGGLKVVRDRLLRIAMVTTPNVDEASELTGFPARSVEEMRAAAKKLHELGAVNVVVTGGHLPEPIDLLSTPAGQEELRGEHIESKSTHGTGCAFATSLACNLALGRDLRDAVVESKAYVREAILRAYPVGKGTGPLNHLFRLPR
jgi:hydroxymethylpyrimidine/phosphomethylpyrimidine kinase